MNRFSNNTAIFDKIYFPVDPEVDLEVGPSIEESGADLLIDSCDVEITGSLDVGGDLAITGDITGNSLTVADDITTTANVNGVDGAFSGDVSAENVEVVTNVIGAYSQFSGGGEFGADVVISNDDDDATLTVDILVVSEEASFDMFIAASANMTTLTVDTEIVSDSTIVDLLAQTIRVETSEYAYNSGTISAEGLISSEEEIQSPLFTANVDVENTTYGYLINARRFDDYGVDGYLQENDFLGWYGFSNPLAVDVILSGIASAATQNHEENKYGTGLVLFNTPDDDDEQIFHIRLVNEYTYLDQDTILDSSKFLYWGDPDTEGTVRIGMDGGSLVVQENQSSVWTTIHTFSTGS